MNQEQVLASFRDTFQNCVGWSEHHPANCPQLQVMRFEATGPDTFDSVLTCPHSRPLGYSVLPEEDEVSKHPMVGRVLSSRDPEPPEGTVVRDDCGIEWRSDGACYLPSSWSQTAPGDHDHETWTKIAGNYGPVTILEWGDGD